MSYYYSDMRKMSSSKIKKIDTDNDSKDSSNMNKNNLLNYENSENLCVVCFKNVNIYSIGECDHPVCYECSTRMRVLCEQNECPICRQSLSKVIFTDKIQPYRQLEASNRSEYYNKKHKICFANIQIQKAFYDLLDYPCTVGCKAKSFNSFDALKDHVRKEHELFYCDICTEHLKIFPFERKCYNRTDLALHRRKGDKDNTSHRGHPLCVYCDVRYLDKEELFRHLRREHYFCHLCDADGSNQFYSDYNALCEHFRTKHFLCEEGECASEQFTVVFRSEIDLKAHIATFHGKSLGKQQAKQARTLQLEITLGPRGRNAMATTSQHDLPSSLTTNSRSYRNDDNNLDTGRSNGYNSLQLPQNTSRIIDASNDQEFPSLRGVSSTSGVTSINPNMSIRAKAFGPANLLRSKEDFPALGSSGSSGLSNEAGFSKNQNVKNNVPVSAIIKKNAQKIKQNSSGGMVIHVSNRPNSANNKKLHNDCTKNSGTKPSNHIDELDFPALPLVPSNMLNNTVSAKHKHLINDYVSVTNNLTSNSKISIKKNDSSELMPNRSNSIESNNVVPSLNEFPALCSLSNTSSGPLWVKSQKIQDRQSHVSKVTSAPILNISSVRKGEITDSIKNNYKLKNYEKKLSEPIKVGDNGKGKQNKEKKKVENIKENKRGNNNNANYNNNDNNNKNKKDKSCISTLATGDSNDLVTTIKDDNNKNKYCDTRNDDYDIMKLKISHPPGSAPMPYFIMKNGDTNTEIKSPPPGFKSVTLNSVAKSPNNLMFTTSLGESFSIVPNRQYIPPSNSVQRNRELVEHFQSILKSPEAFEEFKYISKNFREDQYKTLPYYEHCRAALKHKFDELFPELLALLPVINKQQELYLVHCQYMKDKGVKNSNNVLTVCQICKQVLIEGDLQEHITVHSLQNNFPAL